MIRHGRLPLELTLLVLGALSCLLASGCRCASEPAPPAATDAGSVTPTCRRSSIQLTLEGRVAPGKGDPEPDPSVELPFAPEPGVGLALGQHLFATGLRREGRSTVAMLARFGPESEPPELIEVARLQGDAAPPRLATDGKDLLVGVQSASAGGHELRVARVHPSELRSQWEWRTAPHQSRDESNVFDLGASDGRTLVVWDEWFGEAGHGRILISVFADDSAATPSPAQPVSGPAVDAESPRLSRRSGGYWLSWLVNADGGARRVYDPGQEASGEVVAPPEGSYGARGIEIVAIDAAGQRAGAPIRVTSADERVVGYDLTTSPTGAAWLVWRHAAPSPGASGGRISMAEVHEDGRHEVALLEEQEVGAGEPSWLSSGEAAGLWLTFPDEADRTLLFRVERAFETSEPLRLPATLGAAAALGAASQRILFAAARGGDVELFPARCDAPAPRAQKSREPEPAPFLLHSSDAAAPTK